MARAARDINLEDPVTAHMRTDHARIGVGESVAEALASLRRQRPGGRIVYFYVLDATGKLVGVVPTRRLLLEEPTARVAEIMIRDVIAVPQHASVLDACEFFILHRFLALPIVDAEQRLLGVIDVELYTDEINELGGSLHDDLFQLIGVHVTEARMTSAWLSFRYRFPWLMCNIAGGIVAALLSGLFEAELQRTVALAVFIPVVLALSESVSIQSLTLSLQTLHGPTPPIRTLLGRMRREAFAGLLLGLGSAAIVGLAALVWLRMANVAIAVSGGIAAGVAAAAVMGLTIPLLLRKLRLDPQIAAGPIALAASDVVTLVAYFLIARWMG